MKERRKNQGKSGFCLSEASFDSGHPWPSPFGLAFGTSIFSILKKFVRDLIIPSN